MFEQVKLGYDVNGLEPHIDQLTIETHYGKHHAAYTKMFNELAEKAGVADKTPEEMRDILCERARESMEHLKNYKGLELRLVDIQILPALTALCA